MIRFYFMFAMFGNTFNTCHIVKDLDILRNNTKVKKGDTFPYL